MPRPICYECGKQLMYVFRKKGDEKRVPVWLRYVDPAGHEHKLHLECARTAGYSKTLVKCYGEVK